MTTISVSGEVFKDIREQIERQSEIKCENCYCINDDGLCTKLLAIGVSSNEVYHKQKERCNNICFEQKPIQLILPEDVLKCSYLNEATNQCTSGDPEGDDCGNFHSWKCKKEIPLNEPLTLVCGECEGKVLEVIRFEKASYSGFEGIIDKKDALSPKQHLWIISQGLKDGNYVLLELEK